MSCSPQRATKSPVDDAAESATAPTPGAGAQATAPIDLDGAYRGDMVAVMKAYGDDAAVVKKRWQELEPPSGAAREQVLSSSAAQAELYVGLRNKLTRVDQAGLWDEPTREVLLRGASSVVQEIRQKALLAASNGSRAWSHKCSRELESADRIVAHYSGLVFRLAQARPAFAAQLERSEKLLATLQAQRGNGWLAPILAPVGIKTRSDMFGPAPKPSPLPPCPELVNVVAPLGPAKVDAAPLPDGLQVPPATRVVTALGEGPRIYASALGVYFGERHQQLARLGSDAGQAGVAMPAKRGPSDLLVLPLLEALRAQSTTKQVELLIFADEATPVRVLLEILFTGGEAGYARSLLVTRSGDSGEVQGLAVAVAGPLPHNLAVFVVNLGYGLALDGKRIAARCGSGPASEIAVPLIGAKLDTAGLANCVAKLLPADERSAITIAASADITYSDVIATAEVLVPLGTVQFGIAPSAP